MAKTHITKQDCKDWEMADEPVRTAVKYIGEDTSVHVPNCTALKVEAFAGKEIRSLTFDRMNNLRLFDNAPMPGLEKVEAIDCYYDATPYGIFLSLRALMTRIPTLKTIRVFCSAKHQLIIWREIPALEHEVKVLDPNCIRLTEYGMELQGLNTDKLRLIVPALNPTKADDAILRAVVYHSFLMEPEAFSDTRAQMETSMHRNGVNWLVSFMQARVPESILLSVFMAIQPLKSEKYDKLIEAAQNTGYTGFVAAVLEQRDQHVDRAAEERKRERAAQYEFDHPFSAKAMKKEWNWEVLEDKTVRLTKCRLTEQEEILIPPEIGSRKVTALGSSLFCGFMNLKRVEIPDSVLHIESRVFANTCLTELRLPDHLQSLGSRVIMESQIRQLVLPDSLQHMGKHALCDAPVLREVRWPKQLSAIPAFTFYHSGLTAFEYPPELRRIGEGAFEDCMRLKRFVPEGCTEDGFVQGDGLEWVGEDAFTACSKLCSFQLTNVMIFGKHPFAGTVRRHVTFHKDISQLPDSLFMSFGYLSELRLPETLERIGASCFKFLSLDHAVIPERVTVLGDHAFMRANVTRVDLPEGLRKIGIGCFSRFFGQHTWILVDEKARL